jgi:hypothetical protein
MMHNAHTPNRYARLISFVQSNEAIPEGGRIEEALVETLVRDFAATWKAGLEVSMHA